MTRPLPSFGLSLDEMVIGRLLEKAAAASPDREFVYYGHEPWTYRAIDDASARLAGGLSAIGVVHGSRVGLLLPNGPEFINTYFALCKLGATMIPVNTAYRGYMLEYLLNDTDCRILVVHASLLDRVVEAADRLSVLETVIVVGDGGDRQLPDGWSGLAFEDIVGEPLMTSSEVRAEDVNCVIYTSGTTGPSKGVPITNAHGVAKAIEVIRLCEMESGDVIYAPLPLFHSFALLRGVVAALVMGGACALRERFSASAFWDDVRAVNATIGYCVFSIPQILKKQPPSPADRDHSLRCMYNARHDPEFEERFGAKLIEAYGLTEAGVAMYFRPGDEPREGSCGRESEDWDVRLVDDRDVEVPVGTVGEIVLRPRYPGLVTPGYLNKPDATVETFRNLWFHTGDLAVVDEDGYYFFRDRKKDAIRRRGENVSSWEVEQVLLEHSSIAEAAAVPYPSPLGEDDVRVFIALQPDTQLTAEELIEYSQTRLPDFMVPRYVEFLEALPRTPTGRVEKYRLRDLELSDGCYDRGDPRDTSSRDASSAPRTGRPA